MHKMSDKAIAEALGIEPSPLVPHHKDIRAEIHDDEYETAKKSLEDIIDVGTASMNDLLQLARTAPDERTALSAARVMAETMNSLITANKTLMDNKKTQAEIKAPEEDKGKTVNQNLIISTADLARLLKKPEENSGSEED